MKRYKLLKDLPTFKAGQLAYISKQGNLIAGTPDKPEVTNTGVYLMIYHETTLKKFPNILTEWFEKIKEPVDSIHWKPKNDEKIWYIDKDYSVNIIYFNVSSPYHRRLLRFGNSYRSLEECTRVRNRKLAEARLRQTSTFEPDFKNGNGGWIIGYDYYSRELTYTDIDCTDYGEPVRYKTEEDAEKSIKENREDWLIYFGIKEEK